MKITKTKSEMEIYLGSSSSLWPYFRHATSSVMTSLPNLFLNLSASLAALMTDSGAAPDTESTGEPYGMAQSPGRAADRDKFPDAVNATLLSQQKCNEPPTS